MKSMESLRNRHRWLGACALVALVLLPVAGARAEMETGRAAWLLGRGQLEDMALTGMRFEQGEIGGGAGDGSIEVPGLEDGSGMKGAWPVLMSLVLPGAGEVAMGYKRGYFMAAADIFAWTRVAKYHSDGADLRDEYIAYADAHYSDDDLILAYTSGDGGYRDGEGEQYFPGVGTINNIDELDNLPLYVTPEEDFREYYENLGKWDQFIFGWDDYVRPDDAASVGVTYTATGERDPDLLQPWVSRNRETYRLMRAESNDAYKNRDRWLYMNIGLRLVSVLQVAYLQGLLGGGPDDKMEVYGHAVEIRAVPMGFEAGSVSASVSF